MEKLTQILHDVIDAVPAFRGNKSGELHALADQAGAELAQAIADAVEKRLQVPASQPAVPATPAAPVPAMPDGAAKP